MPLSNVEDVRDQLDARIDFGDGDISSIIEIHLLTDEQAKLLKSNFLSVNGIQKGEFPIGKWSHVIAPIFHDWNKKLGEKFFGYDPSDLYECFPTNEIPNPKPRFGDPYRKM